MTLTSCSSFTIYMSSNQNLRNARQNRNDEFYTKLEDIEKELQYYDLSGQYIYSPCDNYTVSKFNTYFTSNFSSKGIQHFTSTCIEGYKFDYNGFSSTTQDIIDGDCLKQNYKEKCVITNPPFSILNDFIKAVKDEKFLIVFPKTALAYNDIFPLLAEEKAWIGHTSLSGFDNTSKNMKGLTFWLTNLGEKQYSKLVTTKSYNPKDYPVYDNFNAIEVSRVSDIPGDYYGDIGVPITFLLGNYSGYKVKGILKGEYGRLGGYRLGYRPLLNGKSLYTRVIIQKQ